MCKILYPYKGSITQKFGANAVAYYNDHSLKGHPGIDFMSNSITFGTPAMIQAVVPGPIYSTINRNNSDLSKYRAVCQLYHCDEHGDFEIIYGHVKEMYVYAGDVVPEGVAIAREGNTGICYSGGREVTTAEKNAGSKKGTHLHLQMRKVEKVKTTEKDKQYLIDENGLYQDKEGFFYYVPDFDNGFNGCVDFKPNLYQPNTKTLVSIFKKVAQYISTKINRVNS
jgi:murein DD-endopeptidase MepM/ murein hydrolase activator NlpD